MKRNILVFPCGSEIGLDIHSSVCYSTHFHLIGASSVSDHGLFVYDDYIPDLPYATSDDFIPTIARIVKERHIDAIYPTMDSVISVLKENEVKLGCKIVSSPAETTKICLSKELTYYKLKDTIHIPQIFNPTNIPISAFPIFAKPKIGYGAKGTKLLNDKHEVDIFIQGKDDIMLLEYLPGEEFTVDCFTDRKGNLLYSAARKRNRIKDGISVNTFFVDNQEEFLDIANRINKAITFRGAWFFQVKRDKEGKLCLLEIASRLGGSSLLSRAIGVNFALLSLFDIFNYDVEISPNNYHVELDRALDNKYRTDLDFEYVYCDYDDCLILDQNRVNIELVKFLYKCVNEKKKIILLTKHKGNLTKELKVFRLDCLFDKIIHIEPNASKADFIQSSKAIFIDDSNAERMEIKEKFQIPVFSPDMIDILL